MDRLVISSPAKVNLYLRIIRRRKDGYHDLVTLFHRISLCDRLEIRKSKMPGIKLVCSNPDVPSDERNLVCKAYAAMKRRFPQLGGVHVKLTKRIPAGAGLGGGSSNAAHFLMGANRLFGLKATQKQLFSLGAKLGADVPFFLLNVNQAIAAGRGDRLQPARCKKKYHFLLLIDNKELSTKAVYENLALSRGSASLTNVNQAVRMLCTFLDRKEWPGLIGLLRNDLEKPAFRLRPAIKRRMEALAKGGFKAVRMSGSGPTVFILLPHGETQFGRLARKARSLFPSSRIEIAHTF